MRDRKGIKTAEGHSGGPGRNTEREIIIRLCSMRKESIFNERKGKKKKNCEETH